MSTTRVSQQVSAPRAPERQPPRILFVSGLVVGFATRAAELERLTRTRTDIDAVHLNLLPRLWIKVLAKALPGARGWDLNQWRFVTLWRPLVRRRVSRLLRLGGFDAVVVMPQGFAGGVLDAMPAAPQRPSLAIVIDATQTQNNREFDNGRGRVRLAALIRSERRVFAEANLIVCTSRWAERSLREDYRLPEPIETPTMLPSVRIGAHREPRAEAIRAGRPPRILLVGNPWRRKGFDRLLRWHQDRWSQRAELVLVCRRPPLRVRLPGELRNVTIERFVPRERLMDEIMPGCDLFVMPTRRDQSPWVVAEAQAAGLPVVASSFGAIPEMVLHERTGILCPSGDDQAFIDAVERLLDDPDLIDRMGEAARRHAESALNTEVTNAAVLDAIAALANAGSARELAGAGSPQAPG